MKVFIPISDAQLSDQGELRGTPVPFTLDLLAKRTKRKDKQEFKLQQMMAVNLTQAKPKLNA